MTPDRPELSSSCPELLPCERLTAMAKAHASEATRVRELERENAELRVALQNCLDLAHGKFPPDHPWTYVNAGKVLLFGAKEAGK